MSSAAYSTGIDFRSNVSGTNSTSIVLAESTLLSMQVDLVIQESLFANATAENTFSDTMTLKAGNIGIGRRGPDAQLELSKSAAGALGPVLKLRNTGIWLGPNGNRFCYWSGDQRWQKLGVAFWEL